MKAIWPPALIATLALATAGCSDATPAASQTENIIQGEEASDYPESVLIFGKGYPQGRWAAGTLIAPDVVLTFDVMGTDFRRDLEVIAPHVGEDRSVSDVAVHSWGTPDTWPDAWHDLDWNTPVVHEVALLKLTEPIVLDGVDDYPVLAEAPVADGTEVIRIGSNDEGRFSDTTFRSPVDAVSSGDDYNLPTSYVAFRKTMYGDGGGGVFVAGTARPHQLVAVNYGYGDGETFYTDFTSLGLTAFYFDYMVRVDLVKDWIDATIQSWTEDAAD